MAQALKYFISAAEGVAQLHRFPLHVLHLDIKPANIMLDAGNKVVS